MQISRCLQDNTMVPDNFKRNLHFNMNKVEYVQGFHIKMKENHRFLKYTAILI